MIFNSDSHCLTWTKVTRKKSDVRSPIEILLDTVLTIHSLSTIIYKAYNSLTVTILITFPLRIYEVYSKGKYCDRENFRIRVIDGNTRF